ncbi:MAG TPA: secernin-3 [Alphaproteobacteria bacterium]|nr:secernin-3 [Alphaproteobacteria bacterium]
MCDSLVAAGTNTADGTTVFAKNSDRHAGECQPFVQLPAAFHPRGAQVRCTHVSIPQVAETYRVMGHSPWWVWGFEHGVNEHGVAIGNQTVFSREPVEEVPGLIGMDLVRLGLERGRDAREALEVIAALIEQHGQGGSGFGPGEAGYHNSFTLADPEQAWVMETTGRRWAAREVDLASQSNHMALGPNWSIGSRDLESFARLEGWWSGRARLDVAAAYRNPNVPGVISEGRLARSSDLLEAGRGKHDVAGMMAALRDHGRPGALPPTDRPPEDLARYSLCMHAEPVGTTTASLVARLPVDRTAPWPVWISFGSPCTGIFLPVYLDGVLPPALATGGEHPPERIEDSAWWVFHALGRAAEPRYGRALPLLRARWAEIEDAIEGDRALVEREARALAVAGEPVEAAGLVSDFMTRAVARVIERALELTEELGRFRR